MWLHEALRVGEELCVDMCAAREAGDEQAVHELCACLCGASDEATWRHSSAPWREARVPAPCSQAAAVSLTPAPCPPSSVSLLCLQSFEQPVTPCLCACADRQASDELARGLAIEEITQLLLSLRLHVEIAEPSAAHPRAGWARLQQARLLVCLQRLFVHAAARLAACASSDKPCPAARRCARVPAPCQPAVYAS